MSYGSDTDANALLTSLTADDTFVIPSVDLSDPAFNIPGGSDAAWYQAIAKLTNGDLTTKDVNGTGTFDVVMAGLSAQLKEEYNKNRISGAEYTKAFIAMAQTAMQFSVQFLLGRDQAFWQGIQAQIQAVSARVELETAKLRYATVQLEVLISKANYALTKIKLSTEDANFGAAKYNIDTLLPLQFATGSYNLNYMLPQQLAQSEQQVILLQKQEALTNEQTESARAQTMDTRLDGTTPVVGLLGKQKDLYNQQIDSYKRDSEVKAAKIWSDAWITMKTMDEGLLPPDPLKNSNFKNVLMTLAATNSLGDVSSTV